MVVEDDDEPNQIESADTCPPPSVNSMTFTDRSRVAGTRIVYDPTCIGHIVNGSIIKSYLFEVSGHNASK